MRSNNASVKVPIPYSVVLRWKQLYKHGDNTKIANEYGGENFKAHNVQRAWDNLLASKKIVDAMTKFYAARAKQMADKSMEVLAHLEA